MAGRATIIFLLSILLFAPTTNAGQLDVYIFISPTCPICKVQTLSIRELHQKYASDSLSFTLVFQRYDKKKEIKAFMEKYLLSKLAWKIDRKMQLAKKFDATTTPEAVLRSGLNTLYQGQITNLYYALGKKRARATETYLENALNAYLNGNSIDVSKTEPVGCVFR